MGCNSQTLAIGMPTQSQYDSCSSGGTKTTPDSCSGTSACKYVEPHGRQLSSRKNREKVREDIKDYILLMLGAPTIKVELDEQMLDLAVNQAMKVFEDFAGREYYDYYTFRTVPGKSVYKMPDDVGMIRNVFYREESNFAFQASDLGGAIPIEYYYPGGAYGSINGGMIDPVQPIWGKAGEWSLYKGYQQMFSRMSSQLGGWEWVSDFRWVKLYPIPCRSCTVIVHYLQKCKDWREVTQALQEGALAYAMISLGHIRGKFTTLPGPSGGVQLDGDYMRTKGWELKKEWEENLLSKFGDLPYITMD